MSYQTEREEFIARFVFERTRKTFNDANGNGPGCRQMADAARAILRDANTIQRYAVTACNRTLTEDEQRRESAACLRIERAAAPFKVALGGDPRGYVVKIHFPSGAYNTWGGPESGWGVPTRER